MANEPRIAAHLGRPETPEEAAERKAEFSKSYRQSKTFRNLIVALGVTVVIVGVIIWGVPRGELPATPEIDVAAVAKRVSETSPGPVLLPAVPDAWYSNLAILESGDPSVWQVNYTPDDSSFLRMEQGFGADETWAAQTLRGAAPSGEVTIDGIVWDEYTFSDPAANANISYALGTQAGADHVLLYGSADAATTAELAGLLTAQVNALISDGTQS